MNLPSWINKVGPTVMVDKEAKDKEVEKLCEAGPSSRSSPPEDINSEKHEIAKTAISETNEAQSVKKPVDDARMCKICYGEELGAVFLPCGHIVACVKCAQGMVNCALCRQPVTMTIRTFLS